MPANSAITGSYHARTVLSKVVQEIGSQRPVTTIRTSFFFTTMQVTKKTRTMTQSGHYTLPLLTLSCLEKQTSRDEDFSCPRLDFRAKNNTQRIRPPEGIFQLAQALGTMYLRIRILSSGLEHCGSMSIKESTSKECCYLQQVHPEWSEIFLINSFGSYLVEFR